MGKLVSIVMPAYNREKTLPRAIDSVLRQTYPHWELLICDDASRDGSREVVGRYRTTDPRIQLLVHETNLGAGAARNSAMRAAKGDYIALLDSDDEWLPAKLERQVERMEAVSDDTGVCFCGGSIVKNGDMTKPVPYVPSRTWEHDTFRKYVLGKILFLTSTILFRSICLRKTGLMVAEMRRNQDGEFLLRLLGHFGLCLVPEPYAIWHVAVGPGCNHYGAMVAALPFHLRHRELIRSKLGHWPATHYSCNLRTNILCAAIREGRWRRAGEELWHRWRECPLPLPRDVKMVSRAVLAGGLANLRGYHGERR